MIRSSRRTHESMIFDHHLNLELNVAAVKKWYSSRRLQLNTDKTELIWFGLTDNLKRLSQVDTRLQLNYY